MSVAPSDVVVDVPTTAAGAAVIHADNVLAWSVERLRAARRDADYGHWLLMFGFASIVMVLLFAGAVYWRLSDTRRGIDAIAIDSILSITAADRAAIDLNQMDTASVDNALAGPSGDQSSRSSLTRNHTLVDIDIRNMSQNVTLGEAEELPISNVQTALSDYSLRLGYENSLLGLGFPIGMDHQRAASDIIDQQAVPSALQVDTANGNFMTGRYRALTMGALIDSAVILGVGTGLLLLLVVGQVFIYRWFHRVLNPMMAVATVLLLLFTLFGVWAIGSAQRDVAQATENAYTSIHTLRLAQLDAAQARRYQGLFLLQPGHGGRYAGDFKALERRIFCAYPNAATAATVQQEIVAGKPASSDCQAIDQSLAEQIRSEVSPTHGDFSGAPSGRVDGRYTGYLADTLRNVSYGSGELDGTLNALLTFGVYESTDAHIRELDASNQHADAVALQRGEATRVADTVQVSMQRVIAIDQAQRDSAMASAYQVLDMGRVLALIVGLVAVALIWIGLQPILSRYRLTAA